jgi:hypothetical protein
MEIRKENAKKLAEGYTPAKRRSEIACLVVCGSLWTYNLIHTLRFYVHSPDATFVHFAYLPVVVLCGILTADFVSGVAHWALDTWGSTETPVFGFLIRSFREHHVDQTAITRHDFIETNGDNSIPLIPVLFLCSLTNVTAENATWRSFIVALCLFVSFTNQFHKWSHETRPAPIGRWLMKRSLVLTPAGHRVHHKGEFDKSYCITTGWLNPPLDAINFWRHAEALVTLLTGAIPRANDKALLATDSSK